MTVAHDLRRVKSFSDGQRRKIKGLRVVVPDRGMEAAVPLPQVKTVHIDLRDDNTEADLKMGQRSYTVGTCSQGIRWNTFDFKLTIDDTPSSDDMPEIFLGDMPEETSGGRDPDFVTLQPALKGNSCDDHHL